MIDLTPIKIPIESLIVLNDENGGNNTRLLYFDPKGQRNEVVIPKKSLTTALSKLDGTIKAISRTSGGVVMAQPCQLVLYHCIKGTRDVEPELRVKVRFKDLTPAENEIDKSTQPAITIMIKSLLPEEILEPIDFSLNEPQRYLLDFGRGPIPICIFGFFPELDNQETALFVEPRDFERSIRGVDNNAIPVQRYSIPKEVVRVVRGPRAEKDYGIARRNYEELIHAGVEIIPDKLKVGPTIELPSGLSYSQILEFLRRTTHSWNRLDDQEITHIEVETVNKDCINSDFIRCVGPI